MPLDNYDLPFLKIDAKLFNDYEKYLEQHSFKKRGKESRLSKTKPSDFQIFDCKSWIQYGKDIGRSDIVEYFERFEKIQSKLAFDKKYQDIAHLG
jgi:hypothetical protein